MFRRFPFPAVPHPIPYLRYALWAPSSRNASRPSSCTGVRVLFCTKHTHVQAHSTAARTGIPNRISELASNKTTTHPTIAALLSANARWAHVVDKTDPLFFRSSFQGQFPKILWIGCADSRVPETLITSAKPGDIFVHRNVANQFHPSDDSAHAVLDFALDVLRVEHVIVVGHTSCGGVAASLEKARLSSGTSAPTAVPRRPIDRWLEPLADLARSVLESSKTGPHPDMHTTLNEEELAEKLVEANVRLQVANVCAAEPVIRAWKALSSPVWVHGLVYDVGSGRLRDLNISKNGL